MLFAWHSRGHLLDCWLFGGLACLWVRRQDTSRWYPTVRRYAAMVSIVSVCQSKGLIDSAQATNCNDLLRLFAVPALPHPRGRGRDGKPMKRPPGCRRCYINNSAMRSYPKSRRLTGVSSRIPHGSSRRAEIPFIRPRRNQPVKCRQGLFDTGRVGNRYKILRRFHHRRPSSAHTSCSV